MLYLRRLWGWMRLNFHQKPWFKNKGSYSRMLRGKLGEKNALSFLKSKGYKIICKNWRYRHSEIDLVVKEQDILVFVEVRSRQEGTLVGGFDSITVKKRQVLKKGAQAYVRSLVKKPKTTRWDVVELIHDFEGKKILEINHYQNVWL